MQGNNDDEQDLGRADVRGGKNRVPATAHQKTRPGLKYVDDDAYRLRKRKSAEMASPRPTKT